MFKRMSKLVVCNNSCSDEQTDTQDNARIVIVCASKSGGQRKVRGGGGDGLHKPQAPSRWPVHFSQIHQSYQIQKLAERASI